MDPPNNATQTGTQAATQTGLVTQLLQLVNAGSIEIIPIVLFALYVIGYLCLNTHLSRFPIIETNIISFNYVKASLVFLVFNLPLISVSRKLAYEARQQRKLSNFVIFLFIIDAYCFFLFIYDTFSMSHTGELSDSEKTDRIWVLIFSYFPFTSAILFYESRKTGVLLFILITVLVHIFLFASYSHVCLVSVVYISLSTIVYFTIFYIDIHKASMYIDNKSLIIPIYGVLLSIIVIGFGGFIYNKIPQVLGGGKAYSAVLFLTKAEAQNLQESCILANDGEMEQQVKIIYSSDKGFYVYDEASVIVIPVEAVKGIRVKRWFWFNSYM